MTAPADPKSLAERLREMAHKAAAAADLWQTPYDPILEEAAGALTRLAELTRERDEARKLAYVPGMFKCAKCGCVTISTNLHMPDGGFSANNEPQRCPNDCGPMWPRTERQAGNDLCDQLEAMQRDLAAAREALTRYGQHHIGCGAQRSFHQPCSCGYSAALSPAAKETKE